MGKSCKYCFHLKACTMADAEGHIPGEDYDVGETCCEYVDKDDVVVDGKVNRFKHLTDEIRELYCSFIESGFNEAEALTMTHGYLKVAFENEAARIQYKQMRKTARSLAK